MSEKPKDTKDPMTMKEIQKDISRKNKNKYFDEALDLVKSTFFRYFFGVLSIFFVLCIFVFSLKTTFILITGIIMTLMAEIVILYKVLNLNLVPKDRKEQSHQSQTQTHSNQIQQQQSQQNKNQVARSPEPKISAKLSLPLNLSHANSNSLPRTPEKERFSSFNFGAAPITFDKREKDRDNRRNNITPRKDEAEIEPIVNIIDTKDDDEFENVMNEADEDFGNDVKINYKPLIKKSPDKKQEKKKNMSTKTDLPLLNSVLMDHNYYCHCKFTSDNFDNIVKHKTSNISSIISGTKNIFSSNFIAFKTFSDIVTRFIDSYDLEDFKQTNFTEIKHDIYRKSIALFEKLFTSNAENNENTETKKNAKFYQNHLLNVYKNKFFKAVSIFDLLSKKLATSRSVIDEEIVENMRNLTNDSNQEMEVVLKELSELLVEVTGKEEILQASTERYFEQKKLIQVLNESYTKSQLKLKKFEEVAKLEMDIKVANNLLNEIQSSITLAVDEYKDSSTKFSKNSIKIYQNMMKVISRDFEVIKAMFIFYFETLKEALDYGKKLYNKDFFMRVDNTHVTPNYFPSLETLLTTNFDILSIQDANSKVNAFLESMKSEYELASIDINNNLESTQNYSTLIKFFKYLINFMNDYKNEFVKLVNTANYENNLKQTTYNVIYKYFSSMEEEIKTFFSEDNFKINEISKEVSQQELRIHEVTKLLKDKYNAFLKKHASLEEEISVYKYELKNATERPKFNTTLNNFISMVRTNLNKEKNDLKSITVVFDEYFNMVISVLDLTLNKTLTSYFDFHDIPLKYIDKAIQYLYNMQLPNTIQAITEMEDSDDIEKLTELINTEISDFLTLNKIRIKVIHEKDCDLYTEENVSSSEVLSGREKDTFDKIKDFVVHTFKKKSYNKLDLIKKIDAIEQEKNDVINKINKNYNEFSSTIDYSMAQENMYKKAEVANWFNVLLRTFFGAWKDNDVFKNFLQKELFHVYNRKRPDTIDIIHIGNFVIEGNAPEIKIIKEVDFEKKTNYEFLYDVDLVYRGNLKFTISTNVLINLPIFEKKLKVSLLAEVVIMSVSGIVRIFFNGNKGANSWYAFLGEPLINFDVNLTVGEDTKVEISLPTLKTFVRELLRKKFRKYALPNKRSVSIPLTKEVQMVTLESLLEQERLELEKKERDREIMERRLSEDIVATANVSANVSAKRYQRDTQSERDALSEKQYESDISLDKIEKVKFD